MLEGSGEQGLRSCSASLPVPPNTVYVADGERVDISLSIHWEEICTEMGHLTLCQRQAWWMCHSWHGSNHKTTLHLATYSYQSTYEGEAAWLLFVNAHWLFLSLTLEWFTWWIPCWKNKLRNNFHNFLRYYFWVVGSKAGEHSVLVETTTIMCGLWSM